MMELILNEDVANDPIIEPKDRILFRHATKCRKVRRKKKKQAADAAAILNIFSEPSDVERLQYLEEELDMTVLNRITTTLGYIPLNLMSVPARNEDGNPVVLKLYPLNSYENNFFEKKYSKNDKDMNFMRGETLFPFPTIFWLYCPQVDARISALEKTGWIQALTDRLQSSSEYLTDMEYAHRAYADERWSLLHPDHITYLESRGWRHSIEAVGIAGMHGSDAVKCLHGHYAHYLARPDHRNIIGQWVAELLAMKFDEQGTVES